MKKIASILLVCVLLVASLGCGGKEKAALSEEEAASLVGLVEDSIRAMSQLKGYRMKGSMEMRMGAGEEAAGNTLNMELQSEVENLGDTANQHMRIDMGFMTTEAYLYEGYYYQNIPGQGWSKISLAEFQAQNLATGTSGIMATEQLRRILEAMEEITVIEDSEEVTGLSLRMGKEFLLSSLASYREMNAEDSAGQMEEWLRMIEESAENFSAEMRIWIGKGDHLIRRMEQVMELKSLAQLGDIWSQMSVEIYDYDADIRIQLPEEAKKAKETGLPTNQ